VSRQRTTRNPPATGYERPVERKFWIWQDRVIDYGEEFSRRHDWERHPWRWLCTLCDPPAQGFRARKGAHQAILTVSMPRHFAVRRDHHRLTAVRPR
jgi:hypothetical protein